jgi:hypothetical protein
LENCCSYSILLFLKNKLFYAYSGYELYRAHIQYIYTLKILFKKKKSLRSIIPENKKLFLKCQLMLIIFGDSIVCNISIVSFVSISFFFLAFSSQEKCSCVDVCVCVCVYRAFFFLPLLFLLYICYKYIYCLFLIDKQHSFKFLFLYFLEDTFGTTFRFLDGCRCCCCRLLVSLFLSFDFVGCCCDCDDSNFS